MHSTLENLSLPALHQAAERCTLRRGALRSLSLGAGEKVIISSTAGECWLTMEGDPVDHVLTAGERLLIRGPGLLLAESLTAESQFNIIRPVA